MAVRANSELVDGQRGQGVTRAMWLGCGGAALVLLGVAVPWVGWYGLRSAGLAVALAGSACLLLAFVGIRHAEILAGLTGLTASLLLAQRLVATPDTVDRTLRSTAGLGLALVGSLLIVAGAALLGSEARRGGVTTRVSRLSAEQRRAMGVALRAFVASRVLVWASGILAVVVLGIERTVTRPPITVPFGDLGNQLAAPASAWDAGWYLKIAQVGYAPGGQSQAFFPLYPDLLRFGAWSPKSTLITGILVGLIAFFAALYLLHRLVALEFDGTVADRTVMLVAFSPMAVFFSAIYTESLFLFLSVAAFYAARRRAWWLAAAAAGLASAARPTGVLLAVPLLIFFVQDRRFNRHDLASLMVVPAGLLAVLVYCAAHGDVLAPIHAQQTFWHRSFEPLGAVWRGARDAVRSLHQLVSPGSGALPVPGVRTAGQLAGADNLAVANLTDVAFLAAGVAATIGALRRLPIAYGAYAAVTIIVTASTFYPYEPLASLPRFLLVLFPCQIWLALWASRIHWYRAAIVASALLMMLFAARFATWHWVA